MNEEIDPSSVFVAAKEAADKARDVLISRLAAIKGEAKQIRELLGRKPRTTSAPKKLGVERKEQK